VNAPRAKASVAALADHAWHLDEDRALFRAHCNEAALPPPEHVVAAVRAIDVELLRRYPGALQRRTIAALARRLDVDPACIVLGNGADDVLSAIASAFVGAGDSAVTPAPAFSTYARAVAVAGGELRALRYRRRWELDVAAAIELADPRTTLVVLGHPNNPTNDPVDPAALAALAGALPNALIVVDEVYLTFSQRSLLRIAQDYANVAVVGSLSKVGALAGLRVGYAVASPEVASAIRRVMPPFPVGAASLIAAEAYAGGGAATDIFERALARQIDRSLNAIVTAIRPRARSIWCGPSNFVLADFGSDAIGIERHLARRGIAIRSFTDPDLAGCLRFCALDERSTSTLVAALGA
jgi:histidinol-phosphate aminotransferase